MTDATMETRPGIYRTINKYFYVNRVAGIDGNAKHTNRDYCANADLRLFAAAFTRSKDPS